MADADDRQVVALVPARVGSRRIPGKNVKPLAGHPVLAYTIAAAQQSGVFAAVVLSTDSDEIAQLGRHYGAEVPFLRPEAMAGDLSPDIEWVRFTLDELAWTGSGRVPGTVMGQFALDESGGVLRVATTVEGTFGGGPITIEPGIGDGEPITPEPGPGGDEPIPMPMPVEPADVDNLVVTLDTEGDLDELGRLAGLGHPGERIQGVRFAGDVAYVVTFLRTDPLYVIDLSDPAAPVAAGELSIPGFSSYLHPVGDGRVVGIGMAGTEDGTLTGAQAQLFDVGDPAAPAVLDAEPLGDESEAGTDHRAFTDLGNGRFAVPAVEYPEYDDVPVPLPGPTGPPDQDEGDEPTTIFPVSPEVYAPQLVVVVLDTAGDGLSVARRFDVSATAGADAISVGYGTLTVPVGDALAVVTAGVGIAVFDGGAGTGTWIDLVR
jgi:hypothetical protein